MPGDYDETLDLTPAKVACTGATLATLVAADSARRIQPRLITLCNNDTVAHRFDLSEDSAVKVSIWVPTKDTREYRTVGWKLPKNTALKVATDATATATEPSVTVESDLATG